MIYFGARQTVGRTNYHRSVPSVARRVLHPLRATIHPDTPLAILLAELRSHFHAMKCCVALMFIGLNMQHQPAVKV